MLNEYTYNDLQISEPSSEEVKLLLAQVETMLIEMLYKEVNILENDQGNLKLLLAAAKYCENGTLEEGYCLQEIYAGLFALYSALQVHTCEINWN